MRPTWVGRTVQRMRDQVPAGCEPTTSFTTDDAFARVDAGAFDMETWVIS